ncbi:unnamed protein product [Linum trigynum]|uniref:RNase H type-1 domain-containing protein n=1 Tax=Linum trigynum TaxID=586398 RepID=A0AAV2CUR5_9ROSI
MGNLQADWWTKPMQGCWLIKGLAWGAVYRDHQGRFLAAATKKVYGSFGVEMVIESLGNRIRHPISEPAGFHKAIA